MTNVNTFPQADFDYDVSIYDRGVTDKFMSILYKDEFVEDPNGEDHSMMEAHEENCLAILKNLTFEFDDEGVVDLNSVKQIEGDEFFNPLRTIFTLKYNDKVPAKEFLYEVATNICFTCAENEGKELSFYDLECVNTIDYEVQTHQKGGVVLVSIQDVFRSALEGHTPSRFQKELSDLNNVASFKVIKPHDKIYGKRDNIEGFVVLSSLTTSKGRDFVKDFTDLLLNDFEFLSEFSKLKEPYVLSTTETYGRQFLFSPQAVYVLLKHLGYPVDEELMLSVEEFNKETGEYISKFSNVSFEEGTQFHKDDVKVLVGKHKRSLEENEKELMIDSPQLIYLLEEAMKIIKWQEKKLKS